MIGGEQHEDLQRFSEIVEMSKTSAFKEMQELIASVVEESHESLVGCLSTDPMIRMGLSMRYQQRIAFQREIENWVQSAVKGQEEILETMKQELDSLVNRGEHNL